MMEWLRANPTRLVVVALAVVVIVVVGLLQFTRPCTSWREWKRSKQGPGIHTDELLIPPFYCLGSRNPRR